LDSCAIGNSPIWVDVSCGEEVGNKFDDTRDASGTADYVNPMGLLNRVKSTTEEILEQLFKV
jgi:hypothetical protein